MGNPRLRLLAGLALASVAVVPLALGHEYQLSSRQLTHCHMLGNLPVSDQYKPEVVLHVWLKIAPTLEGCNLHSSPREPQPPSCGATRLVKGFAFLEGFDFNVTFMSDQIWQPVSPQGLTKPLSAYIWSPTTKHAYNITWDMPSGFPSNIMIVLQGELKLEPDDVGALDFELRVPGFEFYCIVPAPPLALHQASEAPSQAAQRPNAQQTLTTVPTAGTGCRGRHCGVKTTHVKKATLTKDTQVVVVYSNYFGLPMSQYVRALMINIIWHHRMGATRFIQYVTERLTEFVRQPEIKALVDQGLLEVVLWDDLPGHETAPHAPVFRRDADAFQHFFYNHAALRFWRTDTLLLTIDPDEFIMYPEQKSLVEIFKTCGADPLAGSLVMSRYDATCKLDLPAERCDPKEPMIDHWLRVDLEALAKRQIASPVTLLDTNPNALPDGKALVDPNAAKQVWTHKSDVQWPATQVETTCAEVLHVNSLFRYRKVWIRGDTDPQRFAWEWPGLPVTSSAEAVDEVADEAL